MSDRYPNFPAGTKSVTEIIKAADLMPDYSPSDAEWYMNRGSMIHLATELHDRGTLDESTVDHQIYGYLESWKKLNLKYLQDEIEIKLYDPIYQYCGTLDRFNGDIKSGVPAKWHKLQLGAYYGLLKANNFVTPNCMYAWYLQEDGSIPKIVKYSIQELRDALKIFQCALAVVRWKS